MFRGGELFSDTAPLRKVLSSTGCKGLRLSFRPVRLCLGLEVLLGCLGFLNAP